jgi:hypothetical protein
MKIAGVAMAAILLCVLRVSVGAEDPPKEIAFGAWSKPVLDTRGYAVRGRLVLCEHRRSEERRDIVVYVELQDASDFVGSSVQLYCDMGRHDFRPEHKSGLECALKDKNGRPVEGKGFPFGGAVPMSQWVRLPKDASIRLRATPFGIYRPGAMAICPHLGVLWVIDDGDPNVYTLSGAFTIEPSPDNKPPIDEHVWRGTITLPEVKVVSRPK